MAAPPVPRRLPAAPTVCGRRRPDLTALRALDERALTHVLRAASPPGAPSDARRRQRGRSTAHLHVHQLSAHIRQPREGCTGYVLFLGSGTSQARPTPSGLGDNAAAQEPHIFRLAKSAFDSMTARRPPATATQAVLVAGESGAVRPRPRNRYCTTWCTRARARVRAATAARVPPPSPVA